MANVKLSQIASGGAVAGATDQAVIVRSGATDLLVTPVALDLAQVWLAAQTFTNSDLKLLGSSTGATTFVSDNAGATNYSMHIPAANDTLVALAATQTLTNKTLTSPTLTTPALGVATATSINGNTITTGTGILTLHAGITLTGPVTSGTVALINPPPQAGGATITLTAASSGKPTLLDTAAGTVVTLPAATGTGNKFPLIVKTSATSNAHKVLAVGSDYLIGEVTGQNAGAILGFQALASQTFQSLQMPFSGSQPSGGIQGDWFELTDIASGLWHVKGMFGAGTTATTPFNTANS